MTASNAEVMDPLLFRLFDKCLVGDGCWEWQASSRNSRGYGAIGVNSHPQLAHRVAWEVWNGPIPEGMHVLHRCDNRRCIRPDHLFLGTHLDNMRDAVAKGRSRRFGVTHCIHGHEYTEANTRWQRGQRVCLTCTRAYHREYERERRARLKAETTNPSEPPPDPDAPEDWGDPVEPEDDTVPEPGEY